MSGVPEHRVLAKALLEQPCPALLQSRAEHPWLGPPCWGKVLQPVGLQGTPMGPCRLCEGSPSSSTAGWQAR